MFRAYLVQGIARIKTQQQFGGAGERAGERSERRDRRVIWPRAPTIRTIPITTLMKEDVPQSNVAEGDDRWGELRPGHLGDNPARCRARREDRNTMQVDVREVSTESRWVVAEKMRAPTPRLRKPGILRCPRTTQQLQSAPMVSEVGQSRATHVSKGSSSLAASAEALTTKGARDWRGVGAGVACAAGMGWSTHSRCIRGPMLPP